MLTFYDKLLLSSGFTCRNLAPIQRVDINLTFGGYVLSTSFGLLPLFSVNSLVNLFWWKWLKWWWCWSL